MTFMTEEYAEQNKDTLSGALVWVWSHKQAGWVHGVVIGAHPDYKSIGIEIIYDSGEPVQISIYPERLRLRNSIFGGKDKPKENKQW